MPKPDEYPPGDYAEIWKKIDSLEKQGLFKSALEQTEALHLRAKADGKGAQVIKTLLFRGKYTTMLEEDGFVKAVQQFEAEVQVASEPEKSILQNMLGQLYRTYLDNQRWRIQERTPIPDGEGGDIMTWSAEQLEKRALYYLQASVQQEQILLATPIDYVSSISRPGQLDSVGNEPVRPTLFDLLAQNALDHFADEQSYLTEPAYKFYLDQPEAFAPTPEFVKFKFETRDSSAGKWLAIQLFQRILATHLAQNREAALIDAELKRLRFVKNSAVLEDKDELYRQALAILHKTYYNHPSDAEIVHQLALGWIEQDQQLPESKGDLLKQAEAACSDAIKRHPNTFGARQCAALLHDLRLPALSLAVEQVNLPDKPALISISYKNVSAVWVKVVQVSNDPDQFAQVNWEQRLEWLNSQKTVQQKRWAINNPGDYRMHRTELSLDALPAGSYFALVSSSETFDAKDAVVSFASADFSQLAGIAFPYNENQRFAVVDRNSGAPLAGVQADFFETRWESSQRRNVRNLIKQQQSDREGLLQPGIGNRRGYSVRLSLKTDTLWLDQSYRDFNRNSRPDRPREVQFFTDRSLYRPGQTVYFKGILLQRDENDYPKIVPGAPVHVQFFDANYQVKSELKLRSNEYGTFNGAFQAPASGLTGQMHIEVDGAQGNAWFNVEEYKRPRFEVTFKPVEGAYRVNDAVTVRGEAKNYAGSSVDGAQVRYRVVRQARFPWWNWYSWKRPFPTTSMEIANGIATTAADGSFEVQFTALPDRSIAKKDQPMFDYQVMVDVTDITGETRSAETAVTAGYVALNVNFDLPPEIELDSLRSISLTTTNTAGQFQAATGTIEIQALVEPKQLFVKRYWEPSDILTLQETDFRRKFPNYAWDGEDNPEKWDKPDFSRTVRYNSSEAKKVDLHGGQMTTGYYQITLQTKDPFGEAIEIKKIVRVWSAQNRSTQFEEPNADTEKNSYEPGETARIWFGGKADRLLFLFIEEREGNAQKPRWLDVAGAQSVDLSVRETDRGGISTSAFAVLNNRVYTINRTYISVPWSNKDLTISYETFRDKLAPGDKEEWRLKISGPKKEKVTAELVAAMYDASLDQFLPHQWETMRFPYRYPRVYFSASGFGQGNSEIRYNPVSGAPQPVYRRYRTLEWFGFPLYGNPYRGNVMRLGAVELSETAAAPMAAPAPDMERAKMADGMAGEDIAFDSADGNGAANQYEAPQEKTDEAPPPPLRKNLNETVFFFPEMRTDADGNVVLKFTMNEALTRWKFLAFAHTPDLKWALSEKTVVTQKDLMILTNPPRFMREGDQIEFTAKVSNLSQETISGTAYLHLYDAASMQVVEPEFGITTANRVVAFTVEPGRSTPVSWKLTVPEGKVNGLTWQVFAEGKTFRDGEENSLPVLTNRMLVTETLPITVRGNQSKTVVFDNLKNNKSGTLRNHRYTLEFTSNPAWYAVQALPYLMEFPHECTEQIFSRFYANTLASSVTQKLPNLRRVYDQWKRSGSDALKSNLSKNQELKTALLEETPWVLDAQSEAQQKQNIALLFDLNRMADEQERILSILAERQGGDGGWSWFPGGQPSWYITQHIAAGFGHLDKLGAFSMQNDNRSAEMLSSALTFCDREVQHQYEELERMVQSGKAKWDDNHLDGLIVHYLYTRSFFPADRVDKITDYYLAQGEKYWLGRSLYEQGMLALALHRHGRTEAAQKIVASLRERALMKEELGMYWPFDWGMYWYQLPIETQALMVEVFDEVAQDAKAVEELRVWLLKNKQTNRWESTKATAEAVYALLLHGDNWLNNTKAVSVKLGATTLRPEEYEAGTGYFKQSWNGAEIKSDWSTIKVDNPNGNLVWGAAYWQYFEDMDKIQSFKKTPLTIVKQLFKEENTATGPKLTAVPEGSTLHPGDKLKVRIEVRVDRPMEFVHLKDMRASGFEPINVLSGYRWQDGLGYYESTKDLATHFFIDYLPRGTFVFEYPLFVNHVGNFSNGITTLQCMYAPEFTSHSEGIRVEVTRTAGSRN
ncbi:MAG: alpha-2-macroglobulin [Lewinellaceae bacterium]|nr:alpha-2-macroglobulin [Saprospiraceae bacterium]MCB9329776.1 alpha-2-macroglobulin [Lewinellaceae bacterium]